jgi:outer membrane protein OmpA-like peptidoglycan-associated protein
MCGNMMKSLGVLLGIALLAASPAQAGSTPLPAGVVPAMAALAVPGGLHAGTGQGSRVRVADNDVTTIASPFLWSATKGADGAVSFAGHVPSKEVHDTLLDGIAQAGDDATTVAAGAPDGFAADAVAALVVLSDLDSGRVGFDGGSWSVTGAVDSADKAAMAQSAFDTSPLKQLDASYVVTAPAVAAAAPAKPVPLAPIASYAWSAEKAADGTLTFAGSVPSTMLKGFLAHHVGGKPVDTTTVREGAPDTFANATLYGLNALMHLDSGKLSLASGQWNLSGTAKTDDAGKAAMSALGVIDTKAWTFDIKTAPGATIAAAAAPAAPAAVAPAPAATIAAAVPVAPAAVAVAPAALAPAALAPAALAPAAVAPAAVAPAAVPAAPAAPTPAAVAPAAAPAPPYDWSAEKASDGSFTFSGSVPTAIMKGFLASHVGGKVVDTTGVAAGAPASFTGGSLYGLNALMGLESGKLSLADGVWSLTGTARTDDAGKTAIGALGGIDTKAWKIDITTAPATIAATPETKPTVAAVASPPGEFTFSATKAAGGPIMLSGDVPSDDAKSYVATFAGKVSNENLKVVTPGPADFAANVLGGIDALGKLDAGELNFAGGKWSLKGSAGSTSVRNSILSGFSILPASADFAAGDIAGPPPFTVCTEGLAALQKAGGAITFDGRTTQFSKGADAQLDAVASVLKDCPAVQVNVAGSTDSDGAADANMALSVARAEAVVDGLVKRGVDAKRLYAVGYGETLPVVPNTTKANKAKNRRIDVKLVEAK